MAGKRPPRAAPRPEPQEGHIAIGWIRRPHGLRGELVVDSLTDFPERFAPGATVLAARRRYRVRAAHPHRGALLVELNGIDSRTAAEALRGLLLEVPEAELAALGEEAYYRHQLVGLAVFEREGRRLGRVEEVLDTGANDVYIVRGAEGELLLPAIDTVIKEVDVAGGRMVVELLPGLDYTPTKARRRLRQSSGSEGASSPS